jgi:hypothetical protein
MKLSFFNASYLHSLELLVVAEPYYALLHWLQYLVNSNYNIKFLPIEVLLSDVSFQSLYVYRNQMILWW